MKRNWTKALGILALVLVSTSRAQGAEPAQYSVTLGAEYSTGDYGVSKTTTIWYFPVSLKRQTDTTALSVTVPYLVVRGPGVVLPGIGGARIVRRGAVTRTRTEDGLGDVLLSGSYRLAAETGNRPRVDLTGKIKLGTADENENLGTGENDLAVQVDLEKGFDRNLFFGSVGYWVLGDPPGVNLKNVLYGSLGFSHGLDETKSVGLVLDAQEAAVSGGPNRLEVSGFLSSRITTSSKLQLYALAGLADGSPDWGAGVFLILSR